MAVIRIEEPTRPPSGPLPLAPFALGFRPFYLLGALFGAIALLVWVLVLANRLATPMPGIWWHAHEMLFGFAVAVIVGFLFTAGKVWTGLATPTGGRLAALVALWLAGRLAMAFGSGWWAALVDAAFLPVCAGIFVRLLVRSKSKRNYGIGALLCAMSLLNLGFHLAQLGVVRVDPLMLMHAMLALVVTLETVMAGRVTPSFTANALPGVRQWRDARLDQAAILGTAAALLLWVFGAETWPVATAIVATLVAALQLVRSLGWNPWATRRNPLLWILHLSHLWIVPGLLLLAAAALGWVPRSAGIHALGIGATGGLIIGMITRTALGHTGRPLRAGRLETSAYLLVHGAALIRVISVAVLPAAVTAGIHAAATLWMLAFALYAWGYAHRLMHARPDGKPG